VWERGAGPTLACGTGACATLVASHSLGLCDRRARVDLPGGPLQIHWDAASGKVFMDGPAEHVFDALIPDPRAVAEARRLAAEGSGAFGQAPAMENTPVAAPATAPAPIPAVAAAPEIDCATVCTKGCIRPDNCPSAEARARVAALLSGSSLDDLVTLASNTLESRTRARFERDSGLSG